MDAHHHRLALLRRRPHVALHHRDVMLLVDQRAVADNVEVAVLGRQVGLRDPFDELLRAPPVLDQVGDGDHLEVVAAAVRDQVLDARHGPVVVHDLADHRSRDQAREAGEVDARLGLPRALQHPARACLQREHMAGLHEVLRLRARVDRDLDRVRAVVRRDAGGHALARLHRDRERRLEGRLVLGGHQVEPELVAAVRGEREADQPPRLAGHEVDVLRRRELRGEGQVPFVLAVLGVADDDHPAGADVLQRLLDGRECRVVAHVRATSFSTYLAIRSTSRLTARPGAARPSVVRSSVSGMSDTAKPRWSTSVTVRLTPSTAIEPFSTT